MGRRSLRKGLLAVGFLLGAPTPGGLLAGSIAIVVGGTLHLWAKGCLEPNRRLVTAGPYRFTRNPFYLGNAFIDAGLCLVIGRLWIALPFALLWGLAYRDTIASEEAKLARLFPEAFARYAAKVPRLVPDGRVLAGAEVTGTFSWDADGLARGQEYARLLGIAMGPAVVWAGAVLRREGLAVLAPEQAAGLASLLMLPVVWVWKLALGSAFRRPAVRLIPVRAGGAGRALLGTGLAAAAIGLVAMGRPVLALLPGLWAGLCAIDALRSRRAREEDPGAPRWRPMPWVALASAVAGVLAVVVPR